MVCKTLLIIQGVLLTSEQVNTLLQNIEGNGEEIDVENFDIVGELNESLGLEGKEVRLFGFPCCSEIREDMFILGEVVHTYYRKLGLRCKECPSKHTVCEKCFGQTNNGFYNFDKISDSVVEVPPNKICRSCLGDNVVDGACTTCNCSFKKFKKENPVIEELLETAGFDEPYEIKHYYMADDCRSCS